MRLSALIATVCVSLGLSSAHFQHVFSPPEVAMQDHLVSVADELLHAESITSSCSSCISMLQIVKNLSYMSEGLLIAALTRVCNRMSNVDPDVCKGVVEEQAPIFRKVLKTMTVSGRDGHLMCAAVLNSCPYPDIEPWTVAFPKTKPDVIQTKKSLGKTFTVLQLSDWHVDPEYTPGSEAVCDKPFCCRSAYTDYSNITRPASMWGEYSCDTPLTLIESLLEFIPSVAPDISFGILTGDVPPHEVWSTLPFLKTQMIQDGSYQLLHAHFDSPHLLNSMLYPAVGNHESAPTNIFPLKTSKIPIEEKREYLKLLWLYKSLSESWKGWLTQQDVEENAGSYVARPVKGLKLISLNTNFCYTLNWWLYEHPMEKDPNGVFAWLIEQLQEAEDEGERVWIIGHIAPGDSTCFHDYSNYYHQIVERYAPHVIAGQFFGHTHKDELQIFYRGGRGNASEAISTAYVAPSITPFLDLNPGFRIYKIDTETFEVVDSITYIADLDQAHTWTSGPNWHAEYSAREAFNSSNAQLPSPTSPLSPEWWHNVTVDMENDKSVFDKYWRFRSKSAPQHVECDDECREKAICGIRAGKSELRCDFESDIFGKSVPWQLQEVHPCAINLQSIRSMRRQH
ncbi:Metallo-dependent phosphatase-like protein [Radiomyces spectabilis]|uniref:Metallo-dependent phosphatase-like protein n=1 Tax=Radiomyces spectabilis TaxID=64574 RepID=UPI00221F4F8A|nr:Metallo-dependent phosphatase-like protein [Radiomyces spectabilis]KAI8365386.1 Metallo-dependent phosphatase-like protein [Radiomyces spectabilis]